MSCYQWYLPIVKLAHVLYLNVFQCFQRLFLHCITLSVTPVTLLSTWTPKTKTFLFAKNTTTFSYDNIMNRVFMDKSFCAGLQSVHGHCLPHGKSWFCVPKLTHVVIYARRGECVADSLSPPRTAVVCSWSLCSVSPLFQLHCTTVQALCFTVQLTWKYLFCNL